MLLCHGLAKIDLVQPVKKWAQGEGWSLFFTIISKYTTFTGEPEFQKFSCMMNFTSEDTMKNYVEAVQPGKYICIGKAELVGTKTSADGTEDGKFRSVIKINAHPSDVSFNLRIE